MSSPRETIKHQDQSYWSIVKRQFKKNRLAVWSLRVVFMVVFIGVTADFLANEKPIYCKLEGNSYFPVFHEYLVDLGFAKWPEQMALVDWKDLEYESVVWALVPYGQAEMDVYNVHYVGPFDEQRNIESNRFRHWLGTDDIGRDVMAGMIHGTRIAMLVGVVSMSISFFIGVLFGSMAGYFGDERLKMSRGRLVLNLVFLFFAFYYGFFSRSHILADALAGNGSFVLHLLISLVTFAGIMVLANLIAIPLKKLPFSGTRINIPMDLIISRLIEILVSIPRLLLILSIVAIAKPSILLVMVIIGATSWTGIARFIRGELLRVRSLEYIEAAQALGYSESRIIFKHAIPNALTAALISVAFGVASAILIESSLSFLGIGVQAEVMTWGKLLNFARQAPKAWWLAIFPGFAIFLTVTVFNLLGEGLQNAMDPKRKQ